MTHKRPPNRQLQHNDNKNMKEIELRDYFAGQVLSGLLANSNLQKEFVKDSKAIIKSLGLEADSCKVSEQMHYHHSMISYKFADAMLEARDKKSPSKKYPDTSSTQDIQEQLAKLKNSRKIK